MKIVQITPYMHPAAGGPPVVVDRLSRELTALGHDVHVVATDLYGGGDREWLRDSDRNYRLNVWTTAWPHGYAYGRSFSSAIARAIRSADIVHIHTLWTYASLAAARNCLAARVPYLVMPHGMLDPHSLARGRWKKELYGRLLEWKLLLRADGMCYTHPEEERLARKALPTLPTGHVIELGAAEPPPVDRDRLRAEFLADFPELLDRRLILFLGRLHEKKGLDLLIPAFERLVQEIPTAHLLLIGPGDAAYVQGLRRSISQHRLDAAVTMTGPLYERRKWAAMAASELFVLPSYQENFALAAVDAIRAGLPVLLSRRVNLWQDLVEARAAAACDLTIASLADSMRECMTNESWRSAAVTAGRALLQRRFNWSRSAAKLAEVYESVVASSSRSNSVRERAFA